MQSAEDLDLVNNLKHTVVQRGTVSICLRRSTSLSVYRASWSTFFSDSGLPKPV